LKYFKILKYIFLNNVKSDIPKYLILGIGYGLIKKITKRPIVFKLFNKKKIYLFNDSSVSSFFTYCKIPDHHEILILREMVKENKELIFIDIGANIGSYSVLLADITQNIIAIEPHPQSNNRLKMNFKLNGIDENKIFQYAIGASNKEVYFTSFKSQSTINKVSKNKSNLKVTQKNLDTILEFNKKYLLKIDVEGYELEVIKGMKDLLSKNCITGIIIESFDGKALKILSTMGFEISKTSANNYFAKKRSLA